GNPFVGDCVNLDPIARDQQQRFGATGLADDRLAGGVARELLQRFHVRGVMTQPGSEKVHGSGCSSALNVIPQRSASAALNPMMHTAATRLGASHFRWRACKIAA